MPRAGTSGKSELFSQKPRVTKPEGLLALASLLLLMTIQGWPSLNQLAAVAYCHCAIVAALTAVAAKQALSGAPPGKVLLMVSIFLYFSLEAALSATNDFSSSHALAPSTMVPHNIQRALQYLCSCTPIALLGYSIQIRTPSLVRRWLQREDARSAFKWKLRYILGALTFTPLLMQQTGDSFSGILRQLQASRTVTLVGDDTGLLIHLAHIGLAAASLVLAEGCAHRGYRRILLATLGVMCLLPHLSRGTRHFTVIALLPAVFVLLADRRRKMQLLVAVVAVLILMQVQYVIRDKGWNSIDADAILEAQSRTAVTGQFESLVQSVALVPAQHDYFRESMSVLFITHNIPRRWWENKPISESWLEFNRAYLPAEALTTSNLTPSILGQYHMNWGVLGVVFVSLGVGVSARLLDNSVQAIRPRQQLALVVVLGMLYGVFVASFRYLHPLYFVYPQAAALIFFALTSPHRKSSTCRSHRSRQRL